MIDTASVNVARPDHSPTMYKQRSRYRAENTLLTPDLKPVNDAFISGNRNLYIDIIEPLGHRAKEGNVWEKVLKLNSGAEK